jgi:hypothetical protein
MCSATCSSRLATAASWPNARPDRSSDSIDETAGRPSACGRLQNYRHPAKNDGGRRGVSSVPRLSVCAPREWRRRLESGAVATTKDLAELEGLCQRHTDLVEMILEGRQPPALSLQPLTAKPLPRPWADQRDLVASLGRAGGNTSA